MKVIKRLRLVADEGKILTDGDFRGYVVDISEIDKGNWYEEDDTAKEVF